MGKAKKVNEGRKKRKTMQRKVRRYMEIREDLQLAGRIPVSAEGAIRDERVNPASQSTQPLPGLIGTAIRKGWAVPEEKKPALVDELIGIIQDREGDAVPKVMAYNALSKAEQLQWERDNPELAGKVKGKTEVNVGVQVNNDPMALWKAALEETSDEVEAKLKEVEHGDKDEAATAKGAAQGNHGADSDGSPSLSQGRQGDGASGEGQAGA